MIVCAGILPVPLRENPLNPDGAVEVQVNNVPAVGEVSTTGCELFPEQMVCGAGEKLIVGRGFTVIGTIIGAPGHPLNVGVMV